MAEPNNLALHFDRLASDTLWPLKAFQGHISDYATQLDRQHLLDAAGVTTTSADYGTLGSVNSVFGDITKLLANPNQLRVYRNPPTVLGVNSPCLDTLIQRVYDEGYALAEAIGQSNVRHIVDTAAFPEALETGAGAEGLKFADAVGRQHVLKLFDLVVKMGHLEAMKELQDLPKERYDSTIAAIAEDMDALGFNGIHRLLRTKPSLAEAFERDPIHITVPFAKGKPTHAVPVLSNTTRAAYINGEKAFVDSQLAARIFTPQQAEEYMAKAFHYAMGESYMSSLEARTNLFSSLARAYDTNLAKLTTPTSEYLTTIARLYTSSPNEAYEAEKWVTIKHGFTLNDPAAEALGAPIKGAFLAAKAAAHAPHGAASGAEAADHAADPAAADGKKKLLGQSGSPPPSVESSVAHPTTTNHSYSPTEGTTHPKAEVKPSNMELGGRLAATGLFSLLAYDGFTHLYNNKGKESDVSLDAPDKKSKQLSFARVLETALGLGGIIGAWTLKDRNILSSSSKIFKG